MGDEQYGDADPGPDVEQHPLHHRAGLGIERAERLVHEQHARIVGKRARDADALLHAARELLGEGVGARRQTDPRQQRAADALGLGGAAPGQQRAEAHVLDHGLPGEERGILEHDTAVGARGGDRLTVDRHASARRRDEAGERVEQRRFPAARRAEHTDELAARNIERDAVEDEPRRIPEANDEVFEGNVACLQ